MVEGRDQPEEVDYIDEADFQIWEMLAEERSCC